MRLQHIFMFFLLWISPLQADTMLLKDNFKKAKAGDYLVIGSNKIQTVMHIVGRQDQLLTIEEIAVPEGRKPGNLSWRDWVEQTAPGNTSWVVYELDLNTGAIRRYYSFTKQNWYEIPDSDNFISKLFNLHLTKSPETLRKKVGPKPSSGPDYRSYWQPHMIIDGKTIPGVQFDVWQTRWPKDQTDLSNKSIEIYLPKESDRYRAYFPYWLQINGMVGKAKVRVLDSGTHLKSPKRMPTEEVITKFNRDTTFGP